MRLLLLLAACAPPERAWLDLPGGDDVRSMLIAVREPEVRVFAHAIDRDRPILLPLSIDEGAEVEAAVFSEPLPFDDGELEAGTGATVRDLPALLAVYTSARSGDALGEWALAEAMSDELAGFPVTVRASESCSTLMGSRFFLPTTGRAEFMFSLGDEVLIGTLDGKLFLVTHDSFRELAVDPPVHVSAGAIDEKGRLWFASTSTPAFTLWSGVLDGGLMLQPIATSTGAILRMEVARTDPLEVVAIDKTGAWIGYDAVRGLREVLPAPLPGLGSKIADLERLEPGHVAGIHSDYTDLYRYRDGAVEVDVVPGITTRMRGVGEAAGLGLIVTTYDDDAYAHDGQSWTHLGKTTLTVPTDVVPIANGFLVGSDLGSIEEYRVGLGFCVRETLPSLGDPSVLGAPLPGGAVFVSAYNRSTDLQVTVVRVF